MSETILADKTSLTDSKGSTTGAYMALTAALLGWMFDGLEMGLFPLVARPALKDLLNVESDALVGQWFAIATAGFLIGAATGGVLFGWLGDRVGRVRAMTLSVLTYAIFSGLCGLAGSALQVAIFRFIAALGMGGEWSLGVALVMELFPDRSRGVLAALIGAAANVGYLLIAVIGIGLSSVLGEMKSGLIALGMADDWVNWLTNAGGWRLLMLMGALPALLTFFIRLFVPESHRWEKERGAGKTSAWVTKDLIAVIIGAISAGGMVYLWGNEYSTLVRVVGSVIAILITTAGYLYPAKQYLKRTAALGGTSSFTPRQILGRMILGASLSGVALLFTWAATQWMTLWADQLSGGEPMAKSYTQISSAFGAILGTMAGAMIGSLIGRRITYTLLCISSMAAAILLFGFNDSYGPMFLFCVFLVGLTSASFYGWLPLYLPELFPTAVRATGQGFGFNFGRILAAVGVLQTGNLMNLFGGSYNQACSVMSLVYIVGMIIIWLAPETHGKPLPE
ncbi:MAG: MFS transporter [Planctomycetota bacterium]